MEPRGKPAKPLLTVLAIVWLVIIFSFVMSLPDRDRRKAQNTAPSAARTKPAPASRQRATIRTSPRPGPATRAAPATIPAAPSRPAPSLDEVLKALRSAGSGGEAPAPLEYPTPEDGIILSEVQYHPSGGDRRDEWIEVHNRGTKDVDLGGWRIGGSTGFTFPAGTTLAAGGYLVACADAARTRATFGIENAVGDWTGSLKRGSGTIVLSDAAGREVRKFSYGDRPPFPALADGLGSSLELRNPHGDPNDPANWGASEASGWIHVSTSGEATSSRLYIYLKGPGIALVDDLSIRDPSQSTQLGFVEIVPPEAELPKKGSVRYSGRIQTIIDGFTGLLLNGGFEGETKSPWTFNGSHSGSKIISEAARSGKKCLAVVASAGGSSKDSAIVAQNTGIVSGKRYAVEFWCRFFDPGTTLVLRLSNSKEGTTGIYVEAKPRGSTPGRPNSLLSASPTPFIYPVGHDVGDPRAERTVTVRATVKGSAVRKATLRYATLDGSGSEKEAPLADGGDPGRGDEKAGDGVWSARIGPFPAGTIITYHVTAEDEAGRKGRFPFEGNPTRSLGLVVAPPAESSELATYSLYLSRETLADLRSNPHSDAYRSATFASEGKVYCDVGIRYRGQTSRNYPKHHYKVRFNADQPFVIPGTGGRHSVTGIDLNSSYADKTYLREVLGYRLLRDLGEPACDALQVRVLLNGSFHGLFIHIESPGSEFLKRNGLEEGWLWKSYSNGYSGREDFELKAGDPETGGPVLDEFLAKVSSLSGAALETFLRERLDVDSFVNYLVACQLMHQADAVEKNYFLHADRSGRFRMLIWDLDLTHGRNFECNMGAILNDRLRHDMWDEEHRDRNLLYGTSANPKCGGTPNAIIDAFLVKTDAFRAAYYERLAWALARLYHPDVLLPKVERLAASIREDADQDHSSWSWWGDASGPERHTDLLEGWIRKRYGYLEKRLAALGHPVDGALNAEFETASAGGGAPLTVTFRNLSTGSAAFEWDFGDGETSREREPTHVFKEPGCRTVTLKVQGPDGRTHVAARKDAVHVTGKKERAEAPAPPAAPLQAEAPPSPASAPSPVSNTF